ncbi:MAG: DUF445 family protein [Clostridium sp.]|uniref:DUF445 family protein n=1 Tax=Clostridium sp. TaxID=1506 RepID=UPI003D6CA7A2
MKFIIGSLVGAIIGYITNWLAIKMLFRPRSEIRLFNVKVPFTPGLIPKEKTRIAKSVGDSIGQHLLTKETIIKSLCSENMNQQLDSWVQSKVVTIKNSEVTVGTELKSLLGNEYQSFTGSINDNISKALVGYLNEKEGSGKIAKYISTQIIAELKVKPEIICKSELYNSIKDKVLNMVIEYKDSDNFYNTVQKILKDKLAKLMGLDKNFEQVVPSEIINNLKVYIYGKRYEIAMEIKKMLKEEKNSNKLREIVDETISTKLSPMVAMFMNTDTIYEKVATGLDEFLDEPKNHNDIALIINDIIDKILKNSIAGVLSELPKEAIDNAIEPLIKLFTTKIVDEKLIRDTLEALEGKFNNYSSIEELLESLGVDYKSFIEESIRSRIEVMAKSDTALIKITQIVAIMISRVLRIEMKSMVGSQGNKVAESVSNVVRDLYNKFIENKAEGVIEVLDIAKIVEEKINEFDVAFSEEIIMEIASKELKAITWLGAILGAIMGVLSPILGSL